MQPNDTPRRDHSLRRGPITEAYQRHDYRRSAATELAHIHQFGRFARWCESLGFSALPASSEAVNAYLGQLAALGRSAPTVAMTARSITATHEKFGLARPVTKRTALCATEATVGIDLRASELKWTSAETVRRYYERGVRRTYGRETTDPQGA
jgi:putative heme degradation protein